MRLTPIPDIVMLVMTATPYSTGSAPRWLHLILRLLAIVFAAATVVYTWYWFDAARHTAPPAVELGVDFPFQPAEHAYVVTAVRVNSPAESAGLRVEDRVIAIEGRPVQAENDQDEAWRAHQAGDSVRLTVRRPGQAELIEMTGIFRRTTTAAAEAANPQAVAGRLLRRSLPLAFAAVGLLILLLRPDDRNVWLLAIFFAGIIAAVGMPNEFRAVPRPLRLWMEVYNGVFFAAMGASFFFLCSVFPARSPIDIRFPWLKWAGAFWIIPIVGEMRLPDIPPAAPLLSFLLGSKTAGNIDFAVGIGLLGLGLVSLAANYFVARDPQARRKIRVIVWGTVVGLGPPALRAVIQQYTGFRPPEWLEMILNAVLLLVPASFAYAVFKQRVLDIPVLLRRSARYVLVQRGFVFLLCFISVGLTLGFAQSLARLPAVADAGHAASTALGAVFGTALLWGGSLVHRRVSGRIDRAFFRSAYDARVILEQLAESSRTAPDRQALALLLQDQLNAALQPASLAVYLAADGAALNAVAGDPPPELRSIPADSPLLAKLAGRAEPWEPQPSESEHEAIAPEVSPLLAGCLVPILDRAGKLAGLLALGERRSEETYSNEDRRLLASVASQAGMALENFRLVEDIAARLETERRTAREMEIARDVQSRLLPQSAPRLNTLECAGRCLQARRVGGDYYDFLELGRDQLGLVLADVSGKGVHAALLMANLQAHLCSLSGLTRSTSERMTPPDLIKTLQQVNRVLWKSTTAEHYATLFCALYDDTTRLLTYANCGHNPPLLIRSDGSVERLKSTAMVVGLFDHWECTTRETRLEPGDVLTIFSDGVTEAMFGEEEFGEQRLLAELRRTRHLPAGQIVTAIFEAVRSFSAGEQSDDVTLVVARTS